MTKRTVVLHSMDFAIEPTDNGDIMFVFSDGEREVWHRLAADSAWSEKDDTIMWQGHRYVRGAMLGAQVQ